MALSLKSARLLLVSGCIELDDGMVVKTGFESSRHHFGITPHGTALAFLVRGVMSLNKHMKIAERTFDREGQTPLPAFDYKAGLDVCA